MSPARWAMQDLHPCSVSNDDRRHGGEIFKGVIYFLHIVYFYDRPIRALYFGAVPLIYYDEHGRLLSVNIICVNVRPDLLLTSSPVEFCWLYCLIFRGGRGWRG